MGGNNPNLFFVRIIFNNTFLSEDFDPGFIGDNDSIFKSKEVIFNKNHIFEVQ
jgi:hypothetical protein